MAVSLIANVMLARFRRGICKLNVGHYRRDCTKAEPPTRDEWLKIVNDKYDPEDRSHRMRAEEERSREKWTKFSCRQRD